MAAREHQGLQFALIIFAMLTVALGVATFMFFSYYKESREKATAAEKKAQESDSLRNKVIGELDELKGLLGYDHRDEIPAIVANYKKDMESYGKSFPEAKQHYRNVADYLWKQLVKTNVRITDDAAEAEKLKAAIETTQKSNQGEIVTYTASLDKNQKDAADEHQQFTVERTKIKKDDEDLKKRFEDKRKELEDQDKQTAAELASTVANLQKVNEVVGKLVDERTEKELSSQIADGKVTWVNQRVRAVWLNLGSSDGLRREISFKVVGTDENNPLKAEAKGNVEVTRILDRHLAEARILEDNPAKPIMPGDRVFSIAWEPGRPEHFALVGVMDINGDGQNDLQKVKDLIKLNGGIVDLELKDDGKVVGEMDLHTQFLVLGDTPSDKEGRTEYKAKQDKLLEQAKGLPIKTVNVKNLLDYLGYTAGERTIPLGADAKASDFAPRPPEGVQRKSTNNMLFKPRHPANQKATD